MNNDPGSGAANRPEEELQSAIMIGAVQRALKRMMKTPEAQAIMEQGRNELDTKQQQEAQTLAMQAQVNPELAEAVAPEIERRRGPVMVMTLLNRHGPQGGPPGDMGGGGDGGGGGGGGGG